MTGPSNRYTEQVKKVLQQAAKSVDSTHQGTLLEQPLEIQYLVSRLVFESSQIDFSRHFRGKMFSQLEQVDALLSPTRILKSSDREDLATGTYNLQETPKEVNKLREESLNPLSCYRITCSGRRRHK